MTGSDFQRKGGTKLVVNPFDFSDDITTALTGLTAAVAAMVAVTFLIALAIRGTFIGAEKGVKATNVVKKG